MNSAAQSSSSSSKTTSEMLNDQLIRIWDIYARFHSFWLGANLVGLGIQIEHVSERSGRVTFALAFTGAHVLTCISAWKVRAYTDAICSELTALEYDGLTRLRPLGLWSGTANIIAYTVFVLIWIGTIFL